MTEFVATILANPEKTNLSDEVINRIVANCEGYKSHKTLKAGIAAEITFHSFDLRADQSFAERFAKNIDEEIDIIVQELSIRKKHLLICDMESTIISNEFLDEIAEYLGVGDKVAEITASAMNGELDFEESMLARLELVKSLREADVEKIARERLKYNAGAKELIAGCREAGIYTMLVSGGFTLFTKIVAEELGFDEHHANELIFDEGELVDVKRPILGKEAKLQFLEDRCKRIGIIPEMAVTVGDGANDIPMLKAAGLGIAYRAKPAVKEVIPHHFNYADLSGILYCLGL